MGTPLECEHANPDNGDTLQKTRTGLAFYRKSTNTPTFTNGTEHWALRPDGLVYWTGESIDPTADAQPAEAPVTAEPAPAVPNASAPSTDYLSRARFIAVLDGNQYKCIEAIGSLNDALRRQRLGLWPPGVIDNYRQGVVLDATTLLDAIEKNVAPPAGMEQNYQLFLSALGLYVTGSQAEAQGLGSGDQAVLTAATNYFQQCDRLMQQARQGLE